MQGKNIFLVIFNFCQFHLVSWTHFFKTNWVVNKQLFRMHSHSVAEVETQQIDNEMSFP